MWIIVMFYHLFELSFGQHSFTAEDPLVSKCSKESLSALGSFQTKIE